MNLQKKILLAAIFAFLVVTIAANFDRIRLFFMKNPSEIQSSVLDATQNGKPGAGQVDVLDVENASVTRSHE